MQKIWKISALYIIAALALPTGIFASSQNVRDSGEQPAVPATQLVKVVSVQLGQTVVPSDSAASKSTACSLAGVTATNLVQNAEAVNLNQPASCFNLASVQLAVLPQPAVVFAQPSSKVTAPSQNSIAEIPSFQPTPLAQEGVLPGLVFTALGIILFEEKKSVKSLVYRQLGKINSRISLNQLEILRC